jgi:hypothetical protein
MRLLDYLDDSEKNILDYKQNSKIKDFENTELSLRLEINIYSAQESQAERDLKAIDERIKIHKAYRDAELAAGSSGRPDPHIREITKLEQQRDYIEKNLSVALGSRKKAEAKLIEISNQAEPLKLQAKLEAQRKAHELYLPVLSELQKSLEKAPELTARAHAIKNMMDEVFPYISNRQELQHREIVTGADLQPFGAWPELFSNVAQYEHRTKELEKAIKHSEKVLKQTQKLKKGA